MFPDGDYTAIHLHDTVPRIIIAAHERYTKPLIYSAQPVAGRDKGHGNNSTGDWVTAADIGVQRHLTAEFKKIDANVICLGEEGICNAYQSFNHFTRARGHLAVFDPIDGTNLLKSKRNGFATMVAEIRLGKPAAAWLVFPDFRPDCPQQLWQYHAYYGDIKHGLFQQTFDDQGNITTPPRALSPPMTDTHDIYMQVGGFQCDIKKNTLPDLIQAFASADFNLISVTSKNALINGAAGTAALDGVNLLKGHIDGLLISATRLHDYLPIATLASLAGFAVTTLTGQPYLNYNGTQMPPLAGGIAILQPQHQNIILPLLAEHLFAGRPLDQVLRVERETPNAYDPEFYRHHPQLRL